MRLCHTSRGELSNNFSGNYDGRTPVLVASADPLVLTVAADQWFGIELSTPFPYNNRDNLIVETRWANTQREQSIYTWSDDVPLKWCLISYAYNATTGTPVGTIAVIRVTYNPSGAGVEPTSLGRVRALFN